MTENEKTKRLECAAALRRRVARVRGIRAESECPDVFKGHLIELELQLSRLADDVEDGSFPPLGGGA